MHVKIYTNFSIEINMHYFFKVTSAIFLTLEAVTPSLSLEDQF